MFEQLTYTHSEEDGTGEICVIKIGFEFGTSSVVVSGGTSNKLA